MEQRNKLTIAEEFLLLALDDEKGVVCNQPFMGLEFGLAGAVLMDLSLQGKIKAEENRITVLSEGDCCNEMFDDALKMIAASEEIETPRYWVWKLGIHIQEIKDYFLEQLVEKGILEKKEQNILWIYHRKCYPLLDDKVEQDVKQLVRQCIVSGAKPEDSEIVLISLMKACNLIDVIFSEEEKQKYLERIDEIAAMDVIGQAVYQAIYDILQKLSVQQLYY